MQRIERLLKDELYNQYLDANTAQQTGLEYCQYGLQHHMDVARIAYILVLEHNDLNLLVHQAGLTGTLAAKENIYAAGLLHDIAKWKEIQAGVDHAAYGARLARDILPRAHFGPHEIDVICQAIYEHRNISRDMSFLGERLHRADNLARFCGHCEERMRCPKRGTRELCVTAFEY